MRILLATRNRHKVEEILKIWGEVPFEILTLDSFPHLPPVIEDGTTFEENALKKAREVSRQTQLLTVSDDSGIEVDGLGGQPGVFSARYAGVGASDRENNEKLLAELKEVPLDSPKRKARFRCVAALVDPVGFETTVEGVIEGQILTAARGEGGFGYDPLFFVSSKGLTTAEMSSEEKNAISHRSLAFRKIKEILISRFNTQLYR
jgi:XTP/dITP diphosphohydrolase